MQESKDEPTAARKVRWLERGNQIKGPGYKGGNVVDRASRGDLEWQEAVVTFRLEGQRGDSYWSCCWSHRRDTAILETVPKEGGEDGEVERDRCRGRGWEERCRGEGRKGEGKREEEMASPSSHPWVSLQCLHWLNQTGRLKAGEAAVCCLQGWPAEREEGEEWLTSGTAGIK